MQPRAALVLFLGTFLDPRPEQVPELNSTPHTPSPPPPPTPADGRLSGSFCGLAGPNSKHRQLSRLQAPGPGAGQPAGVRDPQSGLSREEPLMTWGVSSDQSEGP